MDNIKIGNLIKTLRIKKDMTQKDIGDMLNVSDKTISKWETGNGLPDISILSSLSEVLDTQIDYLLTGEVSTNDNKGGNMKNTKFYVCDKCDNIIISTNEINASCCSSPLKELNVSDSLDKELIKVDFIDNEFYVHMDHAMTKENYISFIAYVTYDKVYLNKLYPEGNAEARFRYSGRGIFYAYSKTEGLYTKKY